MFGKRESIRQETNGQVFRIRYTRFRDLLESNAELAKIMSEIESRRNDNIPVSVTWLKSQSARAVFHTSRMVSCLSELSGHNYKQLHDKIVNIQAEMSKILDMRHVTTSNEYTLTYDQITKDMLDIVGGKNSNLGEMYNALGLQIPNGFAITTKAYEDFLDVNDLRDEISKIMMNVFIDDASSISSASESVQNLILNSKLPEKLVNEIDDAFMRIFSKQTEMYRVAMRSSAIGEDGDLSFAGQYLSMLNVTHDKLLISYKYIVASLFTPRAIMYRLTNGIPDDAVSMSVACIEMVNAKAGGVIYTNDPSNNIKNCILITSVFGLGTSIVDGQASPDYFYVSKDNTKNIIDSVINRKISRIVSCNDGSLRQEEIDNENSMSPSLSLSEIIKLADKALLIEKHYGCPQDIEFAVNHDGDIYFLQTRPLGVLDKELVMTSPIAGKEIILEGGDCASPGIGYGTVKVLANYDELSCLPSDTILVAKHSSPKFMLAMRNLRAIVTDFGSITGHMASLARENKIPALSNVKNASSTLSNGDIITVDAISGRIYKGKVDELLDNIETINEVQSNSPIKQAMDKICDFILPLRLVDPKSEQFNPANCSTLHDIMRYVHEKSYVAMFLISDMVSNSSGGAFKLNAKLPIDLYVIDIGNGLVNVDNEQRIISFDNVISIPFRSLLIGMFDERVCYKQPRAINMSGFMSVLSQQLLAPQHESDRFGEKSYSLISDKYMNFSSRVGYHYGVIDSYCGDTVSKNYITFSFKGGAADDIKRSRRARSIAIILEKLDFTVDCVADRVDAKFQKYSKSITQEKLQDLGRLLLFTRQMDMLMTTENSIILMANAFLNEDYALERTKH